MVKHSVRSVTRNVAPISSFRCFPRPAICRGRAAAGLSFAMRLAGPRTNFAGLGPGLRPGSAHLPWPRAVERRSYRGNPRIVALGSRNRRAFRGAALAIFACAMVTMRTARHSITWSPPRRFCCVPVRGCRNHFEPLLAASPYLFFGVMLGASLWYVARRLYGNAGGYIALALYCFSPAMIVNVAGAQSLGEMGAVWGAFGTVFTAIAVAHTLYAPREVVFWNWRRILLLGLSAGAGGRQPVFAGSAGAGDFAADVLGGAGSAACRACDLDHCNRSRRGAIVCRSTFLNLRCSGEGMLHARWIDFEPAAFGMVGFLPQRLCIRSSPAVRR